MSEIVKLTRSSLPRRAAAPSRGAPRPAGGRVPPAYVMPAEWEEHGATWLAWPHKVSDWPGKFGAIPWVFCEIVRHLVGRERVRILVTGATESQARRQLAAAGVGLEWVDFVRAKSNRSWTRDYLPSFVVQRSGAGTKARRQSEEMAAVKWRFNGWARYPDHEWDDAAGGKAAEYLGLPLLQPETTVRGKARRVVLEGGAYDVDGEGTLLTSEACLLSGRYARNRPLSRELLEATLSEHLGIEQVIWLGEGIEGDDTAGHVDDFVRFVRPGVVVLCQEPNRRDPNHGALRAARERIAGARDARGRRLRVVELPMPAPVFQGKQRLPASYANFYIANGVVLVPTFNDPADREALGILRELFPERQVCGIHARDLVLGLGTLHCSTQQEPVASRRRSRSRDQAAKRT